MQLMDKVYEEVAKMPGKMREIFYLSYKEGLKPPQVAERLQISVQTVKNQKVNAIKLLKRSFKDYPNSGNTTYHYGTGNFCCNF